MILKTSHSPGIFLGFNQSELFIMVCHFPNSHLNKVGSVPFS